MQRARLSTWGVSHDPSVYTRIPYRSVFSRGTPPAHSSTSGRSASCHVCLRAGGRGMT